MISLPEHLGLKPLQRAISYTEDISRFYKGNRFMLYNKKITTGKWCASKAYVLPKTTTRNPNQN